MGPSVLMPLNLDFFFSNAVQTNWSINFYLEWLVLCKFIYIYYLVQKWKNELRNIFSYKLLYIKETKPNRSMTIENEPKWSKNKLTSLRLDR
jgi:hypothetical protein